MRVFNEKISAASYVEFDTASNQISLKMRMYNPKICSYEMREVMIDEGEWQALINYGEKAGFVNDR